MKSKSLQKEPLPKFGNLMPVATFIDCCRSGFFIDDDGYGNWATKKEMFSHAEVKPSDVLKNGFEIMSTHVVWFYR